MPDKHSRRSFFKPESFGRLLSTVTDGEWVGRKREEKTEGVLCRSSREAMATRFEVLVDMVDFNRLDLIEDALDIICDLEDRLSVYREESEIYHLNHWGAEQEVALEEDLFGLLSRCRDLWEETGGAFDVTLHSLLVEWGLFKGPQREPHPEAIERCRLQSGMDKVCFNPENRTVGFNVEGLGFNLGAIGKGYALDRVSDHLTANGLDRFLVHGGNSSILGRGSSTWETGWLVDLCSPVDWSQAIAKVCLANKALSTSALSAAAIRGESLGHILDPRTGCPVVTDLSSVSVLAGSAEEAEALSTGLLVMGLDKSLEYCENHPSVGAVLVCLQPDVERPEIILTALSDRYVEVLS